MKYQTGLVKRKRTGNTVPARRVVLLPEDRYRYSGMTSYTPARLTALFQAANSGDIEQLCICGREILERNWDIQGAMDQRADALCGVGWEIRPGGPGEAAKRAADAFAAALDDTGFSLGFTDRPETFQELLRNLLDAVILPFAAAEIVWKDGGVLEGFQTIEPHCFTLRNSMVPRLVTDESPDGMELEPEKFIIHQHRRRPDPARSGKIRVLAWLHCLQNWPLKDLFSFIERFGMPFVVARVDQNTWENERDILQRVIRSFGPDGGGIFTNSTEIQLLNAANTGGDNVYFRALEFCHDAIYTLLVGQLASSGDSAGMSNGDAQSAVRQDILEADARAIESTIRAQIAAPWTRFQFGENVPVPKFHFKVEPPEDEKATADKNLVKAQTIQTLAGAGYKADAAAVSKMFGLPLTYEPVAQQAGMAFGQFGQDERSSAQTQEDADAARNLNLKQKYDAMGVAIRAGLLTATPEIEAQTRTELGLPAMTPEVQKAWEATGGIRQPITLKTTESAAVEDALNIEEEDSGKIKQDAKTLSAEKRLERGEALVAALQWGLIHQTRGTNALLSATLDIPVDAIVLKSEPVREEASGLSDALEEMFGPAADTADRIVEILDDETLSEEERKELLRKIELKTGSGSGMEKLMVKDMEKQYAEGKVRGR